jgi:hypothetical protein
MIKNQIIFELKGRFKIEKQDLKNLKKRIKKTGTDFFLKRILILIDEYGAKNKKDLTQLATDILNFSILLDYENFILTFRKISKVDKKDYFLDVLFGEGW